VSQKLDLAKYHHSLQGLNPIKLCGRVKRVIGLVIEGAGPGVPLGGICEIECMEGQPAIKAEVVGFREDRVLMMPLGELHGIEPGSIIRVLKLKDTIKVGPGLLGRAIDALGRPIDGKGELSLREENPFYTTPLRPLERERVAQPLDVGIRAINSLLTIGKGQKIGIFAGSGVGKSVLMGQMSRNTEANVNVIALIGERGREVKEFIEKDLGEEGLKRSVLVIATSDEPPLLRRRGAFVATTLAEYFRDRGNHVLLMMDSLTRFAMAQREIGLAVGEPPATRGYTPSVFAYLPALLERVGASMKPGNPREEGENHCGAVGHCGAGISCGTGTSCGAVSYWGGGTSCGGGSITGIYTVLVEGDDMNEPIADSARSILDGHIVLSRDLAAQNHYPAIDILRSISRVMGDITTPEQREDAKLLIEMLAIYKRVEDLVQIGAYKKGSNARADKALSMIDSINEFLRQRIGEKTDFSSSLSALHNLLAPVKDTPR
jgi:flagellum-specific ATP synthase